MIKVLSTGNACPDVSLCGFADKHVLLSSVQSTVDSHKKGRATEALGTFSGFKDLGLPLSSVSQT